jgi:transcriptional regulator with XRE-family HTH domain
VSYVDDVGGRLRLLRQQQSLSLQDVERKSGGQWKAAVVGSYERGDRNISAAKLCELAEFYGVGASDLLPADESARPMSRVAGLVLDLQKLMVMGQDWEGVRRYAESVQVQRGDYNQRMLSVRNEDVRAMAIMMSTTPEGLLDMMRATDVLVRN